MTETRRHTAATEVYAMNAARMWSSFREAIATPDGVFGVVTPGGNRYLIRRRLNPAVVAAFLDALPLSVRATVEDPYGVALPVQPPMRVLRMPVMNRPAGPVPLTSRPEVTVRAVAGPDELVTAERVIVEGFPIPGRQPRPPGRELPLRVLGLPGWRVWLAHRDGEPAAACYTYDDGTAVGVYWLATLPRHRSRGLGRAVMTTALSAHPDRTATLVATEAGIPLYAGLGFTAVSHATWYRTEDQG